MRSIRVTLAVLATACALAGGCASTQATVAGPCTLEAGEQLEADGVAVDGTIRCEQELPYVGQTWHLEAVGQVRTWIEPTTPAVEGEATP